ncbi:MAG: amidinotransferase [Actinomycetia bacterium]|nr:amidinotransferase [Actinomycetes bacterium]
MNVNYGVDSMAGPLRRVAMCRPKAILDADPARWHYAKPIDPVALQRQYDNFVALVESHGAEVVWLDDVATGEGVVTGNDGHDLADLVFTYDPSFVIPQGAVLLRPGKDLRRGEVEYHRALYDGLMPIVGTIEEPGTIEGGDCFWLDPTTLAVGRGFRTNQAGIDQMGAIVDPHGITLEIYDLPYGHGPEACLHLLSIVNPLDIDLALVYAPLVPTALYQRMVDAGYQLLHVPAEEFEASAGLNLNVLATGPRQGIALAGFPATVAMMRSAGCEIDVFDADELCIPCEGGPTCLTRPLWRDPPRAGTGAPDVSVGDMAT